MTRLFHAAASIAVLATTCPAIGKEAGQPASRVLRANGAALLEPSATGFLHAVQVYPYAEGTLYRLFAAPERLTDIVLQQGEAVVSVAAGDTARWTVGDTTSGMGASKHVHILVKPFSAGLATNLVITTDRRVYHLQLQSTTRTAMAAISWTYPQDDLIALQRQQGEAAARAPAATGLAVDQLDFRYTISGGRPPWRPVRVFDDGRRTFIEFPANVSAGEVPPLFVLGEKGQAELVNYRMSGRFYVVDRLFSAADLRLGGKRQTIVRLVRSGEPRRPARKGAGS
jgi:type IV secretion system protein VirB9